jgi:Rrf2 family protein
MNIKAIAAEIESPEPFTAKIMQALVKSGIVLSVHGAKGGFVLPPDRLQSINIARLIRALDPGYDSGACVLGLKHCGEPNPCPVHHQYKPVRKALNELFEHTTLGDMAQSLSRGESFLKSLQNENGNNP